MIALAFAVALNKGSKHLNAFFRAVFYAPVVASVVAVSVVWRYILQKDGLLNSLLAVFGIAGPDWLHDTRYALPRADGHDHHTRQDCANKFLHFHTTASFLFYSCR